MALPPSLQSLIHRLQRLLGEDSAAAGAPPPPPTAPAPPSAAEPPVDTSAATAPELLSVLTAQVAERTVEGRLEAKLVEVLRRRESMVSGLVYLVSMERVLAYVRSRKPYMLDKAFQVAESVLRAELVRGDFFAKYRDLGFLVAYANLSREAAQLKSAMLSRLIAEHLVGADAAPELAITRLVSIDVGDGAEAPPSLSFQEIPSLEGLGDLLSARMGAGAAPTDADAAADDTDAAPRRREPAWSYDAPDRDFWDRVLFRLRFAHLPVWSARERRVSNYFWQFGLEDDGGKSGYDVLPHRDRPKEIRELDLYSLRVFGDRLARAAEGGEPFRHLLTVPLHYETLVASKGRFQVVQLARGLPQAVRRRIVFEVVGLPSGVVAGRLLEIMGLLRSLGRSVLLRLPIDMALPDASDPALYALGTALPAEPGGGAPGHEALRGFVRRAAERGCKSYLLGVPDADAAAEMVTIGFDYLAGPGILEPAVEPAGVMDFDPWR